MTEIIVVFFLTMFVRLWSTLVGGGGAIMISTLLFLGLPPDQAIATHRFSALSSLLSLFKFHKQKNVKWKTGLFLAIFTGIGAGIGSFLVVSLETEVMEKGIGFILLLSVPMLFFRGKAGLKERKVKITRLRNIGGAIIMTILGAAGGFFSSMGVWFSYVYIYYYGFTFLQTAGTRKISGASIVIVSLAIFIPAGLIDWQIGSAMLAGGGIGSVVSAHFSTRIGNKWVRNVFAVVVLSSAVKILLF